MDAFMNLLDPAGKEHVLNTLREWADNQAQDSQETIASQVATIKRLMLDPLNQWRDAQKRDNTATMACLDLIFAADEIVNGFEFCEVEPGHIDALDRAWDQFLIHADGGGLEAMSLVARDIQRQNGCRTGGQNSGLSRQAEKIERNQRIAQEAKELIADGKDRSCVSILAKRHSMSKRQIRNILNVWKIKPSLKNAEMK